MTRRMGVCPQGPARAERGSKGTAWPYVARLGYEGGPFLRWGRLRVMFPTGGLALCLSDNPAASAEKLGVFLRT